MPVAAAGRLRRGGAGTAARMDWVLDERDAVGWLLVGVVLGVVVVIWLLFQVVGAIF